MEEPGQRMLTKESRAEWAQVFGALASEPRLRIVEMIARGTVQCREILDRLGHAEYHHDQYLYENFVVRCMLNLVLDRPSSEWVCQIARNVTVFPNGDLCPCYLFRGEPMGSIFQSPFPPPEFFQTWRRVESAARAENFLRLTPTRLWYRPLIGDICLGEWTHPAGRLDASSPLSPHLDLFYDTLGRVVVERALDLQKDEAARRIVMENLLRLHESTLRWLNPHDVA